MHVASEWTEDDPTSRLARGKKCGAAVARQLLDLDAFKHVVPLMMPPANPRTVDPGDNVKVMGGALTVGETRRVNAVGAVAMCLHAAAGAAAGGSSGGGARAGDGGGGELLDEMVEAGPSRLFFKCTHACARQKQKA